MAAATVREAAGDVVKLFVGQVPKQLSEQQIAAIFGEAGSVREINIIKDKLTKQSRGNLLSGCQVDAPFYCVLPRRPSLSFSHSVDHAPGPEEGIAVDFWRAFLARNM